MKLKYEEPVIPRLVPKPIFCQGIDEPVVLLDGEWKIKHTDTLDRYINDTDYNTWEDIIVPSDIGALRSKLELFTGKYIYKKEVTLPVNADTCSYVLRFEGVNGFAKVYIDGHFIHEHKNAFLTWNMDITEFLKGKEKFLLTLTVDEQSDQVSAFNHGGILHSVMLYLLPENYVTSLHTTTLLDENYADSLLGLQFALKEDILQHKLEAQLCDPYSIDVEKLDLSKAVVTPDGNGYIEIKVANPLKWDAEHPRLYTLKLSLWKGEEKLMETWHRFGFRHISCCDNQLYINGKEVKLRGVCRHEISALNGRCLTKELIEKDVALFKEANCNYIRTSHYPPSEYFLQLCDEQGIYVEDELALAFIARTLPYTQRDPKETERYLSHFAEIYARDYSHPSVIIWSLCNESFGGHNFDLLNRYAHRVDPTRPTKFSYPMTMREEHAAIDIWSIHYSNLEEDLAKKCDNVSVGYTPGYDMPVLHDEYAHIPCYNRTEHRRDPNVRNFWGESIKKFWDKIWNTKGALGGAIWAGIDETNVFVGGNTCLEWGIIDIWRRRKPEFYMTRKAYSPIVIPKEEATYQTGIGKISLEVENRFCHTNLSEIVVNWVYGKEKGTITGPKLSPRETGILTIALQNQVIDADTALKLEFYDYLNTKLDEYLLPVKHSEPLRVQTENLKSSLKDEIYTINSNKRLILEEQEEEIILRGEKFSIVFDRSSGLIKEGAYESSILIIGGPYLNVPYLRLGRWKLENVSYARIGDEIQFVVSGSYGQELDVTFQLIIDLEGTIHTKYTIDQLHVKLPKQVKLRVGVDCGGLDELGVYFLAHPSLDTLSWRRKGLWTIYPEDHIARCEGTAHRSSHGSSFGIEPEISWGEEMKNYILNGKYDVDYKGTADFRSLKENIYSAKLYSNAYREALVAISEGNHSVRMEIEDPIKYIISDRDERLQYYGTWYPMQDYSGSYNQTEMWSKEAGAYAECTFTGTGVVWYGPVDTNYGIAKVFIDGELMDASINQRVNGVDFPGSAAGYDKKYGYPLYSITGLPYREHTIRIEVTGEKAEDATDCYIVIDYLRSIVEDREEPIRFIINNDFNYPHIAWGNYCKPPILIYDGYCNQVTIQLTNII